jgi:hypothetical protein
MTMHAMHTPAPRTLRQRVVSTCVLAALLALAPLTAGTALAKGGILGTGDMPFLWGHHASDNHCITPAGTDANEVLGVTHQLVAFGAPPEAGCGPVSPGESWTPIGGGLLMWVMNTSFEAIPPGYEPSARTPMKDFLSKAKTITYIVDSGTARERTYRFRVRDIVKIDTVDEFFAPGFWPHPYPVAQYLAKLPPLPPGEHTYTVELKVSAPSCDGLGTDPSVNCLPAGDAIRLCDATPFTVTQRGKAS